MTTHIETPDPLLRAAVTNGLQQRFGERLLQPGTPGYDDARALWNGMIEARPAFIARCHDRDDVVSAVAVAGEHRLPVAVRGGGHNVAGLASVDGGLVIDLSQMNAVRVEPEARLARVAGGATIADVDKHTQAHGLAVPMGVVSATGIAGLTLGGGLGWLRRRFGLSCDNLVEADVVTADGQVVHANAEQNSDLLWGLRGGGGNFGVVTSFGFRLHPVGPDVAFTFTLYPLERAHAVLRGHEAFLEVEPERVSTVATMGRVPSAEPFPSAIHGQEFIGVLGMDAGPALDGMDVMRPLRELATPLADLSGILPYLEAQRLYDEDYPDGMRYYWKSTSVMTLTDQAIDALVVRARAAPSPHSTIDIWLNGGAMARPDAAATAYGRRDVRYLVNPEANWHDPADDDANIAWARDCLRELTPDGDGKPYVNFPGFLEEGEAMTRAAFGANYARLARLKARYDPENLFARNPNVAPATA